MAIVFTYIESTNKVVVTGGTSVTPATFVDFVTADRAGTDTVLLSASAPASDLALTYAVRPVEDLALKVKCVVANKTAETDYIFITGKDWRGAAQTESIDVSAGNGSYETTKYWSEITTLDCSDNANGGGTVWADGDLTVTQDIWGVIWDYGGGQYRIDAHTEFGDGSTSTYFQSTFEQIYFNDDCCPKITAEATVKVGDLSWDSYGEQGSHWSIHTNSTFDLIPSNGGTFLLYGSLLHIRDNGGYLSVQSGSEFRAYESTISSVYGIVGSSGYYKLQFKGGSIYFRNVNFVTCHQIFLGVVPQEFENVFVNHCAVGIYAYDGHIVASGYEAKASDLFEAEISSHANTDLECIDPVVALSKINIGNADGWVKQRHTVNIHVADKDGTNLASVTVLCEDKNDTEVFSVSTDANGDIAEQIVTYRKWQGTSETLTTYSPHKFTISKAGYETLVLDNITVDGPIDWHFELLPALSEDDVESGIAFGEGKTGNFVVPAEEDVEKDVQYGAGGTEFTGTFSGGGGIPHIGESSKRGMRQPY